MYQERNSQSIQVYFRGISFRFSLVLVMSVTVSSSNIRHSIIELLVVDCIGFSDIFDMLKLGTCSNFLCFLNTDLFWAAKSHWSHCIEEPPLYFTAYLFTVFAPSLWSTFSLYILISSRQALIFDCRKGFRNVSINFLYPCPFKRMSWVCVINVTNNFISVTVKHNLRINIISCFVNSNLYSSNFDGIITNLARCCALYFLPIAYCRNHSILLWSYTKN